MPRAVSARGKAEVLHPPASPRRGEDTALLPVSQRQRQMRRTFFQADTRLDARALLTNLENALFLEESRGRPRSKETL